MVYPDPHFKWCWSVPLMDISGIFFGTSPREPAVAGRKHSGPRWKKLSSEATKGRATTGPGLLPWKLRFLVWELLGVESYWRCHETLFGPSIADLRESLSKGSFNIKKASAKPGEHSGKQCWKHEKTCTRIKMLINCASLMNSKLMSSQKSFSVKQ